MMNVVETAVKEGMEKGIEKGTIKVAKAMIEDGMPIERIRKKAVAA